MIVLESFVQVKEKAFVSKTTIGVVQCQVGAGSLVEEYAKAGAIARLELLEQFGAHGVIARHKIAEDDSAEELIGHERKAQFGFGVVE
jgi:hypothetical protein